MSEVDFFPFWLTGTVSYPLQPITRQVQTTANASQTFSCRRQMRASTLFCPAETEPNHFRKCYSRGRVNFCGCCRGKPAIALPLLTLLTGLLALRLHLGCTAGGKNSKRKCPSGFKVSEDSGRWSGLGFKQQHTPGPHRPWPFLPRDLLSNI